MARTLTFALTTVGQHPARSPVPLADPSLVITDDAF
jgi:hypothetical protein